MSQEYDTKKKKKLVMTFTSTEAGRPKKQMRLIDFDGKRLYLHLTCWYHSKACWAALRVGNDLGVLWLLSRLTPGISGPAHHHTLCLTSHLLAFGRNDGPGDGSVTRVASGKHPKSSLCANGQEDDRWVAQCSTHEGLWMEIVPSPGQF